MMSLVRTWLRRFPVGFAEWAGWLVSVDEHLVKSYMAKTKHDIDREIENNFRDATFFKARECVYLWFCVEVAHENGLIAVRNSADKTGKMVVFTIHEWRAFIDGAKKGEFDFTEAQKSPS